MPVRLVIDSNMLQSSELYDFLATDSNVAVLPDYVWAECYKQASIAAMRAFLSVIGDFPKQIAVLKSGKCIAGLDPRQKGYAEAFELSGIATGLRAMQIAIDRAQSGAPEILKQLHEKWRGANAVMDHMLEGAVEEIMPSLPEIEAMFTPDEIGRCRRKEQYTPAMTQKVFAAAFGIYETLAEIDGRLPVMEPGFAIQTFYYRTDLLLQICSGGDDPLHLVDQEREPAYRAGRSTAERLYRPRPGRVCDLLRRPNDERRQGCVDVPGISECYRVRRDSSRG